MILTKDITSRKAISLGVSGDGFLWGNPSIIQCDSGYICLVKGINYDREKIYYSGDWQAINTTEQIQSKYALLTLDRDLHITSSSNLDTSSITTDAGCAINVEDLRLFWLDKRLMVMGSVLKWMFVSCGARWVIKHDTWRVFIAEIDSNALTNPHTLESPTGAQFERNWIPCVRSATTFSLITNVNTGARLEVIADHGQIRTSIVGSYGSFAWKDGWSGSTCLVPYLDGYISIVHRRTASPPYVYRHMLLMFDSELRIKKRSDAFSFNELPVEFCCGLVVDQQGNSAIIAYSEFDKSQVIIELPLSDLTNLLIFPVDDCNPISHVKVDQNVPHTEAVRLIRGHAATIWKVLDELTIAHEKIHDLSIQTLEGGKIRRW